MQNFTKLVLLTFILCPPPPTEARACQFVFKANISGKSNNIEAKPNFERFRELAKEKIASNQASTATSYDINGMIDESNQKIGDVTSKANQNVNDASKDSWLQGKEDERERHQKANEIILKNSSNQEIKLISTDGEKFDVDFSGILPPGINTSMITDDSKTYSFDATGKLYSFAYNNTKWDKATEVKQNDKSTTATVTAAVTMESTANLTQGNLEISAIPSVVFKNNTLNGSTEVASGAYAVLTGDENTTDLYDTEIDLDHLKPGYKVVNNSNSQQATTGYKITIPIPSSPTSQSFTINKPLYFLGEDDDDSVIVGKQYLLDENSNRISNVNGSNTAAAPLAQVKQFLDLPRNYSHKETGIEGSVEAGVIFNISDIGFLGITVGGNAAFNNGIKLNKENTTGSTTTGTGSTTNTGSTSNTGSKTTGTSSTANSTGSNGEFKSKPSFTLALEGGANITKRIGLGVRGKYINKRYELTHSRNNTKNKLNLSAHQFEIGPVMRANLTKHFSIEAGVAFCPGSKLTNKKLQDKALYDIYTTPSVSVSLGAEFRI